MSSSVVVLRAICKANGISTSGSSSALLERLLAGKKNKATVKRGATHKKEKKQEKKHVKKAHVKKTLFKGVKGGGERLSAATYFKQVAGGKLYNCKPQWIRQPNGSVVLKKIKMCNDAWGGRCAKWVNARA